jgi:hypothetical protein
MAGVKALKQFAPVRYYTPMQRSCSIVHVSMLQTRSTVLMKVALKQRGMAAIRYNYGVVANRELP